MAEPKSKVASLNPDEMMQGGLPDDFDGWVSVKYVPWTYSDRSLDHYVLACRADYVPDPDSGIEPFSTYYSAGGKSLSNFVPSMDGETPAGQTLEVYRQLANGEVEIDADDEKSMEGIFALKVGKVDALNNNSKLAEFAGAINELIKAAKPAELEAAGWKGWSGSTECMTLYGHFNRVPAKDRSGLAGQKPNQMNTILVMTELKPRPKGQAAPVASAAVTVKPKPAAVATSAPIAQAQATQAASSDGSLPERVAAEIVTILAMNESGLNRMKFAPLVMKKFAGTPDVGPAIKLLTPEFFAEYAEGRWAFDPESGLVLGLA